jgi:hypothetical protein
MHKNILAEIPGDIVSYAGQSLPDAETCAESSQYRMVRLPDGRSAELTFVKLTSKKGRTSRVFWTPERAIAVIDEAWLPTPANINALPEPVRRYVHSLETLSDPAGLLRDNAVLKEQIAALMRKLEEHG